MARMRAVDAAAAVLRKEGATTLWGISGAAINPLYTALRKDGGFRHFLARHVEGASHMAKGFTRTKAGNIGVCIGTSDPAGTDMITGLYSASADSIPILCITGQAPRARLHKGQPPRRPPADGRHGRAADLAPLRQRDDARSNFVIGIGNRWANRHTGSVDVYTKRRGAAPCISTSSRRRSAACSARTTASCRTPASRSIGCLTSRAR